MLCKLQRVTETETAAHTQIAINNIHTITSQNYSNDDVMEKVEDVNLLYNNVFYTMYERMCVCARIHVY